MVKTALHGPWGTPHIEYVYQLLDKNNLPKRYLDNVQPGGRISYDALADIHRKASLTVKDDGSIDFTSDRIKVFGRLHIPAGIVRGTEPATGGYAEFPLGVFLLSSPKRTVDVSGTAWRTVDAYDQMKILRDDRVDGLYHIPAGTNFITAVSTILTSAGITLQNLTPTTKTLPSYREWEGGTPKATIINDLLKAINYWGLHFDEDGYAVAKPYVAPADAASEYTYADDGQSVIVLGAVEQDLDMWDVPNKWVLYTSDPTGSLRSVYTNTNANSPTSTTNRGYAVVRYTQVDAPDQATLDALAQRQATEDTTIYEHVRWESWAMLQHSHMDTYTLNSARDSVSGKYRETNWDLELRAGGRMSHTARKAVTV